MGAMAATWASAARGTVHAFVSGWRSSRPASVRGAEASDHRRDDPVSGDGGAARDASMQRVLARETDAALTLRIIV